ncbi:MULTISPECIES: carbohydrate kinase family protein [Streptomyces]|uniref:Fructokinase n=1 Tax=Streptomyces venezuelae (strain ATCC 10712 / CBS 650.69 / DSM 40230 / JCM 4526 / NBRC 13096 / PD 04745) TaxID=953739 RepID=F2R5N4_STRVP|nr:carbohydrate kinase [Streptomyces venezuelae]APE19755.1 carbohydrate kinase [Streptomyces venezuelae]QER97164.1 carbohydrate kinase [Streptomyces venezuelae ATCC 10712]CCA53545.1 Fructokinase [Streptomyces venezuelae ATCC 10712]
MSFLVIGECVADIVRAPAGSGDADRVHPGGSPANVAYGLGRLGRPVTLLTQLADDPTGRLIEAHLQGAGVRVEVVDPPVRTPSAVVGLDARGHASYTFDIAWTLTGGAPADLAPGHVHIGSIAAVTAPGAAAVLAETERLRDRATVSYDPNVRPALMGEHGPAVTRVERCVGLSDLVKASDEDLAWLYPGEEPNAVAARWLSLGPAVVLVTRGAQGALAFTRDHTVAADAPRVTVVDTVGAGDSFMSAALDALVGRGRDALGALGAGDLAELLRVAAAAAAVTVSRAGAQPPDRAELDAALERFAALRSGRAW